jgi:6-phosphogluconolactonase
MAMESPTVPAPRRSEFRPHPTHLCAVALLSAITLLSGCGSFFTCEGKASCPTACVASSTVTCPPPTTGTDFAYVANSASSANTVNGYNLANGNLTTNATGAPFSFGYQPIAMAVTPANTFLYAVSNPGISTGYLYGYSIATSGALNILSGGMPLVTESAVSLAVSPDGNWLFVLDANSLTLSEYSINTSTGAVTFATTGAITPGAGTTGNASLDVAVAPSGDYVAVALGTGGLQTFTFDTTTGVLTPQNPLPPLNSQTGIYAVAIDANNYLYAAATNGLAVFSATTAGVPTAIKTYTAGSGPRSVAVNPASTFVYVGNKTDSTISGFSIGTNAVLTAISGSPFTGPTSIGALAIDNTGGYLIASGYNTSTGTELFSIGTTGALTSSGSAGTSANAAVVSAIAATH